MQRITIDATWHGIIPKIADATTTPLHCSISAKSASSMSNPVPRPGFGLLTNLPKQKKEA